MYGSHQYGQGSYGSKGSVKASYSISCEAGSFALTGNNANFLYSRKISLSAGSFALTGNNVNLRRGYVVHLSSGNFSLTGNPALPKYNRSISLASGSFQLAGRDANFTRRGIFVVTENSGFKKVQKSIFRSKCPKIIYDLGGNNQQEIFLQFWVPELTDFGEENIITHEAELTCDRAFIPQGGNFLEYSGFIHLFKYGTEAKIKAKFNEIYQYNHRMVTLFKHNDGEAYNSLFFMQCYPANLRTTDYRDLLYIRFRSLEGIDFNLFERSLTDDFDRPIYDDKNRTVLDDLI